ncbi:NAD-dependent epimerase/dehydratase family protein [Flavobacterium hauense]
MKKKILIAGASGFVGSNLSRFLKDDYDVSSLSLRENQWKDKQLQVDSIINLVGKAHDHKGVATENDFFYANYELTKQLFAYFLNSSASLFIHISSIAALEEESSDSVVTEGYISNPVSAYGRSKRKAEEFLLAQQLPTGKKVLILRPTMIHGPGDKGNLMLLYKIINKGIPYPLGAFDNNRSFTGIDNLCFLIKKIIENGDTITSGAYNVADDSPLSTLQIIKTISGLTAVKSRVLRVPVGLIRLLAKTGDVLRLPLNSKRLVKMTSNLVVSNTALKKMLEIQKLPLTAQEGLDKTIRSFIS